MNNSKTTFSVSEQFNHLTDLILKTWNVPDEKEFLELAKVAFNQGLADAQLWVNQYITFRVGEKINSNSYYDPLVGRKDKVENGKDFYLYDALCKFDDFIHEATYKLHKSELEDGRWCYSDRANSIINRLISLSKVDTDTYNPVEMSTSKQQYYIDTHHGLKVENPWSINIATRICYDDSTYTKNEQGYSHFYTLFSAIYSYGLACSQEYNDQTLVSVLSPIYLKYRDLDLNNDNKDEILAMAREHYLMPLFEEIQEFHVEKLNKNEKEQTIDTSPEAIAQRKEKAEEIMAKIATKISSGEWREKERKEQHKNNAIADAFKAKTAAIQI